MKETYKKIQYREKFDGEIWKCITKCPLKGYGNVGSQACLGCKNFIQDYYDNREHKGYIKCKGEKILKK